MMKKNIIITIWKWLNSSILRKFMVVYIAVLLGTSWMANRIIEYVDKFKEYALNSTIQDLATHLNLIERAEIRKLLVGVNSIADNTEYQSLFEIRNRELLYQRVNPLFNILRDSGQITHWYFIEQNGTCFLRVHDPKFYGDQINRATFSQASTTQSPSAGIELGKTAFALRVVVPFKKENNELLGFLEFAQEIDHFLNEMQLEQGIELAMLAPKSGLSIPDWQKIRHLNDQSTNEKFFPEYLIVGQTSPWLESSFSNYFNIISQTLKNNKTLNLDIKTQDHAYLISNFPIHDTNGVKVGHILVRIETDKYVDMLKKHHDMILYSLEAMMLISFSLAGIFLFYYFLGPLNKLKKFMLHIQNGELHQIQFNQFSRDEIGDLQNVFLSMQQRINDHIHNLNEANAINTMMLDSNAHHALLEPRWDSKMERMCFDFRYVNSLYLNESGHTKNELLGHDYFAFFPNEDNYQIFLRVLHEKEKFTVHAKPVRRDDPSEHSISYWNWVVKPIIEESSGQVKYLHLELHDVTQEKQAKDISAATHDLMAVALESISTLEFMRFVLNLLINRVEWLSMQKKGSISKIDKNRVIMIIHEQLPEVLQIHCKNIPIGYCLCGKGAMSREILFVEEINEHHDFHPENMNPHGHIIIPIINSYNEIIAVINLYTTKEIIRTYKHNNEMRHLLKSIAQGVSRVFEFQGVGELQKSIANYRGSLEQLAMTRSLKWNQVVEYMLAQAFNNVFADDAKIVAIKLFEINDNRPIQTHHLGYNSETGGIEPQPLNSHYDGSILLAPNGGFAQALIMAKSSPNHHGIYIADEIDIEHGGQHRTPFIVWSILVGNPGAERQLIVQIRIEETKEPMSNQLKTLIRHPELLDEMLLRLQQAMVLLHKRQQDESMALFDKLTGLHNRHSLDQDILLLVQSSAMWLGLLMVDADYFKQVNDSYGHDVGDQVLIQIANRIKKVLRARDRVYRIGGEEFLVVLSRVQNADDVTATGERIRQAVARTAIPVYEPAAFDLASRDPQPGAVPFLYLDKTVSIGGTTKVDLKNIEESIKNADRNLFFAKNEGRNRVVVDRVDDSGLLSPPAENAARERVERLHLGP
ncbi:hypothetical protein CCP3SC5AM1_280012 [Gammaproteobacteria bacterium]